MKKLFIFLAAFALVCASVFATGPLPINSPLTGTVTFTNGGSQAITNVFEPPFTYAPAFNSYLVSANTNALPLTNTVTATNFIIQIGSTAGAATNATIVWVANPVSTVIQYGTVVGNASTFIGASPTTYTNTFSPAFASAPSVVVSSSLLPAATNTYAFTSVTATGFILSVGNTNQTFYWQAVGPAYFRVVSGPSGTDGVVTH